MSLINKRTYINSYVVGENIKVVDGPFNGFTGSIENVNEEKENCKSWWKFWKKDPLELSYMQVEKFN